ncbi:MAG: thymidine kinase [SAR116 cluster bacterium]|nr:thymidine kinase [SAR116 cluster bacterium]
MAKLYFSYSAMNAGKSTILLQASHNYQERGMHTLLLTAKLDTRSGPGVIASRIGLDANASTFRADTDLFSLTQAADLEQKRSCVLVDEAQFLSKEQVWQLAKIADQLSLPVMCYGLRTDFQGKLFEGSAELLAIADHIREIRTICHCGRKATMVVRQTHDGRVVKDGAQIEIGGNDKYISLCRRHWSEAMDEGVLQ